MLAVQAAALQYGCSGSASRATGPEGGVQRNTEIVHEACDTASSAAKRLDANRDGQPDIVIVTDQGREHCRALDLNLDGTFDSWVYYGSDGRVRRRESDYDRDGQVDEVILFRAGAIAEKHRATMLTGKLDTWEFYQSGRLARTERDSNGDSRVDQWWEYATPGCPTIHADVNGDGRPDPGASVDYCKETGYVPPERQGFRQAESRSFEPSSAVPTEVESKQESPTPGAAGTGGQK